MLELSVALTLLLAVWPICQQHLDIKEHLILVLRKAMFRPDLGSLSYLRAKAAFQMRARMSCAMHSNEDHRSQQVH